MSRLEYSQTVTRKLKNLRAELIQNYGNDRAQITMRKITKGVRRLELFPLSGRKVFLQYDVDSDYRYIFVEHNYFFYRIKDGDTVLVLEMFHEREDFMRKLFGVITTSQESVDYWGE